MHTKYLDPHRVDRTINRLFRWICGKEKKAFSTEGLQKSQWETTGPLAPSRAHRTLRTQISGLDGILDHQLELAHRFTPTTRSRAHHRRIAKPFCALFRLGPGLDECTGAQPAGDAALQLGGGKDADDGEEEHLVEPFSLLLLLLLLLLFVALGFVSFPRMMRGSSLLAMCFGGWVSEASWGC